jgi:hypothetical protein
MQMHAVHLLQVLQQLVNFNTLAANYPGHDVYPTDPNAPARIPLRANVIWLGCLFHPEGNPILRVCPGQWLS